MSPDVKIQYAQQDMLIMIGFLFGVNPQFEVRKSHTLLSSEISTLGEVFTDLIQLKSPSFVTPIANA